jgi:hypothetical protein
VNAPNFSSELLAGALQLIPAARMGILKGALEGLSLGDAKAVAAPLADAIGQMEISGTPKPALDGIVNVGSVVLAGLYAHSEGARGAGIAVAMEQIDDHLLKIPPGAAEANLLKGLQDVTNEKRPPQERAFQLGNLMNNLAKPPPGVSPELLARALQRLSVGEIDNLDPVFKALDNPAVAPLAARTFANAIEKMRATEVRQQIARALWKGFEDKAGSNKVIADARTQVLPYKEFASENLAVRIRDVLDQKLGDTETAANLAKIVNARGLTPELLAGALLRLDRETLDQAFMTLDPQNVPAVANAIVAAVRETDGEPGKQLVTNFMDAFGDFKDSHPKMSLTIRDSLNIAIDQIYVHSLNITKPDTAAIKSPAADAKKPIDSGPVAVNPKKNPTLEPKASAAIKMLVDRLRREVLNPNPLLDDKMRAANLTKIVKGFTPNLLAGALRQFDGVQRAALHRVFDALPLEEVGEVAGALANAIPQIDDPVTQNWAGICGIWFSRFINGHPKLSAKARESLMNAMQLLEKKR